MISVSNQLIDLHKYLVSKKIIPPFEINDPWNLGIIESYENNSHIDYLNQGNWFKDLPEKFVISKEMFMKFCIDFYHSWEHESQMKLISLFNENYSDDRKFIKDYLNDTWIGNEFFCRASERLQSDYELLKLYVGFVDPYGANSIIYLDEIIQNNRELMLKLLADFPNIFMDLNEEFRDDEEFVVVAIKNDGAFLEFASKKIRDNEKLVALAIKNNINAVLYASKRLRDCPDGKFYEQYWHVKNGVEFK